MKRLTDRDTANHVVLLTIAVRVGPPVMLILGGIEYYFWGPRIVWFIVPDVAATALAVLGASYLLDGGARAAGSVYFPGRAGTPTTRQYSEQDALVIRGHFLEAADSYRAIIDDNPTDLEARLRLGALLEQELADPAAAEACYLEIRTRTPTPQQDWIASNSLIDLYERTGRRNELKTELARLARRFRSTAAGASAKRRLSELAADDASVRAFDDNPTAPPR